jgi:two-component system, OmpR family, phosphate regulon response regulator PhoB
MTTEAGGLAEAHRVRATACALHTHVRQIVVIERDPECVALLCERLSQTGFEVTVLVGIDGARAALQRRLPQLVILDWDLPAVITLQLVRWARRPSLEGEPARLIALSSFSGEQHVVSGFEQGVDDYVIKPFSVAEVVARVHAVLRSIRAARNSPLDNLAFGHLSLDTGTNRLQACNTPVSLRTMELRLLSFLMRHPERPFTRETLLQRVWGMDSRAGLRAVNVTVQRVRQALAPHGCAGYLQSVRGIGYVLSARASG